MSRQRLLAVGLAPALLAACSLFGDKEDESLLPVELVDFDASLEVRRAWQLDLGDSAEFLLLGLRPVGDGSRIYAAGADGNVFAIDPDTGKPFWRTRLDLALSSGPAVGDDFVVVVSSDGELIALDAGDGNERWRVDIGGDSLASPLVTGNVVVVQTIDNRLRAVSSFDGSLRWSIEQATPALTLRRNASPIAVGSDIIAAFDSGRMVSVDRASGDTQWDSMVSPPSGRSDLERMTDIDGVIAALGQDIYAAGFQGRLAAIAAESGQVLWSREISSYVGVAADWNNLYTTAENGEIIALAREDGTEIWRHGLLLRRQPTLPVPFYTTVAAGDFEGYVHFFSTLDGRQVARLRQGSAAITTAPVAVGDLLIVQSDSGSLAAYRVNLPARPPRDRDIAGEGN